nr:Mobile element protein [Klebsiella pneumoniae]
MYRMKQLLGDSLTLRDYDGQVAEAMAMVRACVEQDDKGWDARKRAYCLKIQPATGSFARNLIYSTKPL